MVMCNRKEMCHEFLIYFVLAFKCVKSGRDLNIPLIIPMECLKTSEEIICNSYDHSEMFSSVSRHFLNMLKCLNICLHLIIPI